MSNTRVLSTLAFIGGLLFSAVTESSAQAPILDLDNPARQPFRRTLDRIERRAGGAEAEPILVRVPEGKRLVIEQVTFRAPAPANAEITGILAGIQTFLGNDASTTWVLVHRQLNQFIANQQMRVYADPGSSVVLSLQIESPVSGTRMEFRDLSVSGYFVDLP
jgi:hypothetical protein